VASDDQPDARVLSFQSLDGCGERYEEFDRSMRSMMAEHRQHAGEARATRPGADPFPAGGYAYGNRVTRGSEFLTSDWPCFDLKDSANNPLLREEIGRNPEVVCYMPLTPRIAAVFFATNFSKAATKRGSFVVTPQKDFEVKNQNTPVVQKAERFVVAPRAEPYIYRIAAKRKKGLPSTWHPATHGIAKVRRLRPRSSWHQKRSTPIYLTDGQISILSASRLCGSCCEGPGQGRIPFGLDFEGSNRGQDLNL
jgi:hypothetical protein